MSSRRRPILRPRAPLVGIVALVAVAGCGLATEGNLVDNGGSRPDASFDTTPPWPAPDASDGDAVEDVSLDVHLDIAGDAPPDAPKDVEGDVTCWAGMKACGAQCVATNDPQYGCAGASCDACTFAHATAACTAGNCALGACKTDFANCDGQAANGCEVTLGSDPANCGACGQGCSFAHATAKCTSGVCQLGACDLGYGDCDADPSNGCEAILTGDPNHCGACPTVCPGVGGSPVCVNGTCGVSSCNAGLANCDANPADCETNVQASVTNCGFCGNACKFTNGTPVCTVGSCQLSSCKSGYGDCDGNVTNGCETSVATNPANCGGCGKPCPAHPNGASTCTGGKCGIACASGFGDCNSQLADGCEVNLDTNPQHCGSCGGGCPVPAHATATCSGGLCGFGCQAGFADCNNNPADGCEVNLATDAQHCGTCAKVCASAANATATCSAGLCAFACNGSFRDCDGAPGNGCEVDTSSNPANCGGCAKPCTVINGTPACSSGACTVAGCANGFDDCDKNAGNGCEANLTNDVNNCGSCTYACSAPDATVACAASACMISGCSNGHADCDKDYADGCEVDTSTDASNCGTCGHACGNGESCKNGVCG